MLGKKTGGRRKGTPNKALHDLEAAKSNAEAVKTAGPQLSALQLMQQIYRDDSQKQATRLMAAKFALPYESPALASVKNETEITHRYVARLPAPTESAAAWIAQNAPPESRTVQ